MGCIHGFSFSSTSPGRNPMSRPSGITDARRACAYTRRPSWSASSRRRARECLARPRLATASQADGLVEAADRAQSLLLVGGRTPSTPCGDAQAHDGALGGVDRPSAVWEWLPRSRRSRQVLAGHAGAPRARHPSSRRNVSTPPVDVDVDHPLASCSTSSAGSRRFQATFPRHGADAEVGVHGHEHRRRPPSFSRTSKAVCKMA